MTKDERIAELEREIKEKDELIKQLGEANKFLSSDKVVSEEQCKQIAREVQIKVFKENIMLINRTIRHEICEKIRKKAEQKIFYREMSMSTFMAVFSGALEPEGTEYITYYTIPKVVLDKIEQGD